MTQEQIRKRREALLERLRRLSELTDVVRLHLRALQARCRHPNAFKTSHMGESCTHCPDCGNCP